MDSTLFVTVAPCYAVRLDLKDMGGGGGGIQGAYLSGCVWFGSGAPDKARESSRH